MIDHITVAVSDIQVSKLFYERALAPLGYGLSMSAGARDNGAPGPWPDYGPNYYACFVLDPDGYNIEAMINKPVAGV